MKLTTLRQSFRSALAFQCLALVLFTSACKSPAQKLEDYLGQGRYAEARALLEEEKVGEVPSPKASPEAVELRTRFTSEIETTTQALADQLIAAGSPREARDNVLQRVLHCPWSPTMRALADRCDGLVAKIGDAERRWKPEFARERVPITQARRFLAEVAPDRPWILDSVSLREFETVAVGVIIREWSSALSVADARLKPSTLEEMWAELRRSGLTNDELADLEKGLSILARLPVQYTAGTRLDAAAMAALREARAALGADGRIACTTRLAPCVDAVWAAQERWASKVLRDYLEAPDVTYDEVAEAEAWNEMEIYGALIRAALARAHIHVGARRAVQGIASAVALVHLKRAVHLGANEQEPDLVNAERLARATRDATPAPTFRLDVELEPKVDPEVRSFVAYAFITEMDGPQDALGDLEYSTVDRNIPRVTVSVRAADLVADFSGVKLVNSRYFSHFETVVNPRKGELKRQIDSAEWDVDAKERAYNWAVSSHNSWPTSYSLNSVNYAYSAYSSAVNRFNFLVGLYNSTPSTISQAVYLPYVFRQGTVRFGWSISAAVQVGDATPISAVRESVVSDFVRLDNKGTDEVESYRQSDFLDIDVSADASIRHLYKSIELIKQEMNLALAQLAVEPTANLAVEESKLLGWLFHPWGIQLSLAEQLGLPAWAKRAAEGLQLKRTLAAPPEQLLAPSPVPVAGPLDPESASTALAQYVCMTRASTVEGNSSTGTATLVGADGLLLTCAHVLTGPQLKLEFSTGPWAGVYEGEILFLNTARDVALVRAKGLSNQHWANVRFAPATQGEPIVAIGNPGMDVGGKNLGGMSQGIVSSARLERNDSLYLSADISVASGSSGGPLFSLKDGAIVGVVQLVATSPGFPQASGQVAATGYVCLAAPTTLLSDWLGLKVRE